jgi:hypothetical protein
MIMRCGNLEAKGAWKGEALGWGGSSDMHETLREAQLVGARQVFGGLHQHSAQA